VEDIGFQFRFTTEQRLPTLFQGYAGIADGIVAPANSPAPVPPGTLVVPPRIDSFESAGLGTRQTYTLTMVRYDGAGHPRLAHRHRLRSMRCRAMSGRAPWTTKPCSMPRPTHWPMT
jgi:hypothetical protein